MLLRHPFQHASLCRFEDLPNGKVEVSVQDPADATQRVVIPSRPRKAHVGSLKILALIADNDACPPNKPPLPHAANPAPTYAYKKVAKKVRPVPASLPEDFRCIRRIPVDPLLSLPALTPTPPNFTPGNRLTQERLDELRLNASSFLRPEELKLLVHVLKLNEGGLAWTEAE